MARASFKPLVVLLFALLVPALGVAQQPPLPSPQQPAKLPPVARIAAPAATANYTATTHRVWIPRAGHFAHFTPRPHMRRRTAPRPARGTWPAATLPVGWTAPVIADIPIDGNDTYGDCGWAMMAHVDNVLTLRGAGTASTINSSALVQQYLQVNGGDNGSDEQTVTSTWESPGIAGDTPTTPVPPVIYDYLDIGSDMPTVYSAIAHQGAVCMAFNVPDAWINAFDPAGGVVWDGGVRGDPLNGHFIPLVGVLANGNVVGLTWGSWVQITPAGFAAAGVDPEMFTVFCPRGYNATTGLDFNGASYAQNATFWASMGGSSSLPPSPFTVNPAPPAPPPTPTPPPAPTGLTYSLTGSPPAGAVIDASGNFTWPVPATQAPGTVTVTFTVASGNQTATGSFAITVSTAATLAISPIPAQAAQAGSTITVGLGQYVTTGVPKP